MKDKIAVIKICAQLAISAITLGVAIYFLFTEKNNSDLQKWAFGIIGLILGYWLK